MKRIICLLCILCVLLAELPVFALPNAAISLRADSTSLLPGDCITLTVRLNNCYNCKSVGLVFDYDADNCFEIVDGEWFVQSASIVNFDKATTKTGTAAAAFNTPVNIDQDIFEITLRVKDGASAGKKEITVTPVIKNGSADIPCSLGTVNVNVVQPEASHAELEILSASAAANSEIEVKVKFVDCDKCKSAALVFDYDTDRTFEIISGKWLLPNASISGFDTVNAKAGIAAIAFNSETDINGDVFLLKLKIKENTPLGDAFIKVTPVVKNGSSDIACAGDTVKITIAGQCETIKGDITSDGKVTAKDRMFISRYLAGWNGYLTIENERADVDNDGYVTANDRMMIARYVAGWEEYKLYFE